MESRMIIKPKMEKENGTWLNKIHFSGYFKLPFPLKKKLLMKLQTPRYRSQSQPEILGPKGIPPSLQLREEISGESKRV